MKLCGENVNGWYCTKPKDHPGDHVATIGEYRPMDFSQRIRASRARDEPESSPAIVKSAEGSPEIGSASKCLSCIALTLRAASAESARDEAENKGQAEADFWERKFVAAEAANDEVNAQLTTAQAQVRHAVATRDESDRQLATAQAALEAARQALKGAQHAIHSEYCGRTCHAECEAVTAALVAAHVERSTEP